MSIRTSRRPGRPGGSRRLSVRLAVIALMTLNQSLLAAVITVDGFDSTVAEDGICTLREAITAANADTATGGCAAGSGADVVQLTGDITLTLVDNTTDDANGLPSVTTEITLEGDDHTISRSGGNRFRFFHVATGGDLTLKDIGLTNGLAFGVESAYGGAIYNRGQVAVSNSTISGCQAFAFDFSGSESSANAFGGAVYNRQGAGLDITGSTLSGNSAFADNSYFNANAQAWGGAIDNRGTVTVSSSTLSGNSATASASTTLGNAQAIAYGGTIYHGSSTQGVAFTNTTLSGNSTSATAVANDDATSYSRGGGIYSVGGSGTVLTLTNATVTSNSSTASATATLGSANAFRGGDNIRNGPGSVALYTVFADGDCNGSFATKTNCISDDTTCVSPATLVGLDPTLSDNGGPTLTHALFAGSSAIGHAGTCGLTHDQRGALRTVVCDAGAYEYGGLFEVDLAITKDDGTAIAAPGQTLTYTLVASNNGPSDATSATVSDPFPAALTGHDLTGIVTAGGATSSLSTGPFGGTLSDTVNLPAGASITYTVEATVAGGATGTIVNTASVSAPAGTTDTDALNDSATDTDTVTTDLDFGDAPAPYPTLLADGGARHDLLPGFHLGAAIDAELDGQPASSADGDDLDAGGDDEDGVLFTSRLRLNLIATTTTVGVTASTAGVLNAWIDFNQDGDWADPGEQIFTDQALVTGVNNLAFTVPCGYYGSCATELGTTYARFRLSSAGGVSYDGLAGAGEVEDYQVEITPDNVLDLYNITLDGGYAFYACESIFGGRDISTTPDMSLVDPADVLLNAGNQVVLRNGSLVQSGAQLGIQLGAVPGCP